jgi:photosynthesis system II assembly factor YCF48-like protein
VNAPRDRDQAVERLLRQSLKTPAHATGSCIDPETLAAWADGSLSGHELELAQSHVADCGRCQEVLAVLVHGTRDAMTVPSTGATPSERFGRRWLAWFVPLTAAAAALAIWVAVPRGPAPEPQPSPASPAQTAQAKSPEAPSPGARRPSNDVKETSPASPTEKRDQPQRNQAQEALSKDSNRREVDRLKQESEPGATADRADKLAAAEPAAAPFASADAKAVAPPPAAPAPARGALQERTLNSAAQKAASGPSIASRAQTDRWRISGSLLQRSTDAGATWNVVATVMDAELTTLSSPSPDVCWVVGRFGLVLRTTDGQNFSRVAFPETTDLSAVQATDAQSATVTASNGRVFTTTDGGGSWK